MSEAIVRLADWQQDEAIRTIRDAVFVDEQQVPLELERDAEDGGAIHFLLFVGQQPVGTARLLPSGSIGRVAILAEYRGQGLGRLLMLEVMGHATKASMQELTLSAQTHALDFYRSLGFKTCSPVYLDAGIPHQDMYWNSSRGV